MRDQIVGKCSICGGRVLQHKFLHMVGPMPPAECERCHAQEASGPVIPMEPQPKLPWLLTFKDSDLWLYQTL